MEDKMAGMMVQHTVKDFATWKKFYDDQAGLRKSSGMLSDEVYRDAADPNKLTVLTRWNSMANAQKFAGSPELKEAMEKAGIVGMPMISFMNEA
jgi:heme-degrading monooxygenase HmoA